MKKIIFILYFLTIPLFLIAKQNCKKDSCYSVFNEKLGIYYYLTASKPTKYIGGDSSLYSYIYNNVQFDNLAKNDIDFSYGEKLIMFIYIDENGKLADMKLVKKSWVTECGIYDKQIVKLIKDIPQWIPAECNGIKVPYRKSLFISFSLRNIDLYIKNDESP